MNFLLFRLTTGSTLIDDDKELLELNLPFLNFAVPNLYGPSRFVIRLVLDQDVMHDKNLEPVDVARILQHFAGSKAQVLYSESTMKQWVIRIRLAEVQNMVQR